MVSSTVSRPLKQDEEGVSSNAGLADSRVASAAGEGTAETGIEVDSAVGEVVASTGARQKCSNYFSLATVFRCWLTGRLISDGNLSKGRHAMMCMVCLDSHYFPSERPVAYSGRSCFPLSLLRWIPHARMIASLFCSTLTTTSSRFDDIHQCTSQHRRKSSRYISTNG